jgi:hypothetical protein
VQAYSGCRVSEIADCSTGDFNFVKNGDPEKVIPGKWFLFIGEDHREPGCTTKGHKSRYMPLHPEIVKRLIPYLERVVAEHGQGPRFRHVRPDKEGRRSTYIARKIDDWMDGVIKDPNHINGDKPCGSGGLRAANPIARIGGVRKDGPRKRDTGGGGGRGVAGDDRCRVDVYR